MREVTEYLISEAYRPEHLENDIRDLLAEGYQPYGPLIVIKNEDPVKINQGFYHTYYQALIKYR